MKLPTTGLSADEIRSRLRAMKKHDVDWRSGKAFGYVYKADESALRLAEEASTLYLWENGLDPSCFPSLLEMENDILSMAKAHVGGGDACRGSFTSGGTESVMLAVKAARDWAKATKPAIEKPEIIVPISAHPCFHKAAAYFGVEVRTTPISLETFKADVQAMADAITDQTILLVASAPGFAHGVIDPVEDIAGLAADRGLLCHVDACIGGFILPFFRELGQTIPPFDFRVEGVTSLSMDLHKYAYTPKGASVVLYRDAELRKHQIFAWSGWPGYSLINNTLQSSRSGAPLAAAWATLHYYGHAGYLEQARKVLNLLERIKKGVDETPELHILGDPQSSLVAISSNTIDVFRLVESLGRKGWMTNAQLSLGDIPPSLHLTLTPANAKDGEAFVRDLQETAHRLATEGPPPPSPLKDMLAHIDLASLDDDALANLLESAGLTSGRPKAGAEINALLDSLHPSNRDRLMKLFFNAIFK